MLAMGGGLGAVPGLRAADLLPGLLVVLVVSGGMCGLNVFLRARMQWNDVDVVAGSAGAMTAPTGSQLHRVSGEATETEI